MIQSKIQGFDAAAYFSRKTLVAPVVGCPAAKVERVLKGEGFVVVSVTGRPRPIKVDAMELEMAHDDQRRGRGLRLRVQTVEGGGAWVVDGGEGSHIVTRNGCDCRDFQGQNEAGRPRPFCKHVAAVQLRMGLSLEDAVLLADAAAAKAALGW